MMILGAMNRGREKNMGRLDLAVEADGSGNVDDKGCHVFAPLIYAISMILAGTTYVFGADLGQIEFRSR